MLTMLMLVSSESMGHLMMDDFSSMNWSSSSSAPSSQDHHQRRHHHQQPPQQPLRPHPQQQGDALCRDRFGYHGRSTFLRLSCNFCYMYLFPAAAPAAPASTVALNLTDAPGAPGPSGATSSSGALLRDRRRSLQGPANETVFNETCRAMAPDDCRRWRSCCEAADDCCRRQLRVTVENNASGDNFRCKATWDGLRCWDEAMPDSYETQFCPDYLLHSNPTS